MPALVTKHLPRKAIDRARRHMQRQTELDWLRGLMLVLMTVTHLPTWFSAHVGQPFGFVSAAEGFVFLSAYLVGTVYSQTAIKHGFPAMRRALSTSTLALTRNRPCAMRCAMASLGKPKRCAIALAILATARADVSRGRSMKTWYGNRQFRSMTMT